MDASNEFAYVADAVRCHACAARDRAAEAYAKQDGLMAGLAFTVKHKDQKGGG